MNASIINGRLRIVFCSKVDNNSQNSFFCFYIPQTPPCFGSKIAFEEFKYLLDNNSVLVLKEFLIDYLNKKKTRKKKLEEKRKLIDSHFN